MYQRHPLNTNKHPIESSSQSSLSILPQQETSSRLSGIIYLLSSRDTQLCWLLSRLIGSLIGGGVVSSRRRGEGVSNPPPCLGFAHLWPCENFLWKTPTWIYFLKLWARIQESTIMSTIIIILAFLVVLGGLSYLSNHRADSRVHSIDCLR